MSFWAKSTGQQAEATLDQEGAESGKLVRIPDNTMVQAVITDIELGKAPDEEYIEGEYEYEGYRISWNIIEDGEFNGVTVRQNLRVWSNVNSKRDQALDVLAFMDLRMNEGAFMKAETAPDIQDMLDAFQNKPMLVKIRAMTSTDNDTGREMYNQWVAGVFFKKPSAETFATKEDATAAVAARLAEEKKTGPKAQSVAIQKQTGPKAAGPAAKPNGPAAQTGTGETAQQKRERLQRELAEAEQSEANDQQQTQQIANEVAGEIEGAETAGGDLGY